MTPSSSVRSGRGCTIGVVRAGSKARRRRATPLRVGRRVELATRPRGTCHAIPAATGKTCGHVNQVGIAFRGMRCCELCGCTKSASDDRARREQLR